ncbi:MAG: hypothetical protein OEY00_07260 [Gammaproteobacteria bacterium]|nr:hypothetical protein [Gammaproteobacteria bacterium]
MNNSAKRLINYFYVPFSLIILLFSLMPTTRANEYSDSYSTDIKKFWEVWKQEKKIFTSCQTPEKSKRFLVNTLEISGNTEVSEANHEVIEKVILKNPTCLLDTVITLPIESQMKLTNLFFVRPLYHNINDIESSLNKAWNKKKYRHIKSEFIRLKKNIYTK